MHYIVRSLAKETILYGMIRLVIKGLGYMVLRIQTHTLTPHDYGSVTVCMSYMEIGQLLYGLAMDITYCRFAYKLGKKYAFSLIITLCLLTSLCFSTAIILSAPKLAQLTHQLPRYFYYMAAILTLDGLLSLSYAKLRVENSIRTFMLVKALETLTYVVLSFLLLYSPICLTWLATCICRCLPITLQYNPIDAVFISNLLANVVTFIFLLPNFKGCYLVWHTKLMQKIWHYASVSFFSDLFFTLNKVLPMWIFSRLVPIYFYAPYSKETMLASYGVAWKLTLCIRLGLHAFKTAAEPFFFANANRKDAPKLYSQAMSLYLFTACLMLLLFSLNANWMAKILIPNTSYLYAIDTLPYLAFVYVAMGIYYNLSVAFKLSNQLHHRMVIHLCGSIVTGIMAWLWIPKWGHWGCVYASISGIMIMVLLGYGLGQKFYAIPYDPKGLFLLLLTVGFLNQIPLWPTKLAFLGIVWAYLLLNVAIVVVFVGIGLCWYRGCYRNDTLS